MFLALLGRDDEPLRARPLRGRAAARASGSSGGGRTSPCSRAWSRRGAASGDLCDACTKTHINDDPAQYYDYALATMIKFQLHDHICTKILKQDVRACDYSGSKEVGAFLNGILSLGATRDWRDGHQGRDRRADLAARDDGVLRAARRRAGQAQRRPGLHAVIAAATRRGAGAGADARSTAPTPPAARAGHGAGCRRIGLPPPPAPPAERERGVALGLFAEDVSFSYAALLAEIVALGATHVALVVPLYQTDGASDELDARHPLVPHPRLCRRDGTRRQARRPRGDDLPHRAPRGAARRRVARHAGAARSRRLVSKLRRPAGRSGRRRRDDRRQAAGRRQRAVDARRGSRPLAPAHRPGARGLRRQARLLGQLGPLPERARSSIWSTRRGSRATSTCATPRPPTTTPPPRPAGGASGRRSRPGAPAAPRLFVFTELGYRSRAGATAAPWDEGRRRQARSRRAAPRLRRLPPRLGRLRRRSTASTSGTGTATAAPPRSATRRAASPPRARSGRCSRVL